MIRKLMHRVIWGEEKEKGDKRKSLIEELLVDILMDILMKLPGKQVLICRCVSKTFRSVIDSRCFMEKHLRKDHYDVEPPTLLTYGFNGGELFYKVWMCKTRLDDERNVLKVEDRSLWNFPCTQKKPYFHPTSSNGLILARCSSNNPYVFHPIRKEVMKIPQQEDEIARKSPLGFGYDPKGNTHKLICVWETEEQQLVAEIFSLRETDSKWRSLDISSSISALPFGHVSFSSSTVTIRGYVYWTVTINEGSQGQGASTCDFYPARKEYWGQNKNWTKHMVLCFSLEMETFEWFPHPAIIQETVVQLFRLTDLRGTLAMVDFSSEECVGLWTLRNKARGEWSFDYRFDANVFRDKVRNFYRGHDLITNRLHVVGTWKEGLLVRIWDFTFCIYLNLKTERMEYIGIESDNRDLMSLDSIISYTPNYLIRLKTYYDQSRVISAHPHAGARLRGRLHVELTRGDYLAYNLEYFYDSLHSPFHELIGFRTYKENSLKKNSELSKMVKIQMKEKDEWTFD